MLRILSSITTKQNWIKRCGQQTILVQKLKYNAVPQMQMKVAISQGTLAFLDDLRSRESARFCQRLGLYICERIFPDYVLDVPFPIPKATYDTNGASKRDDITASRVR